jgi:hypothetical protein
MKKITLLLFMSLAFCWQNNAQLSFDNTCLTSFDDISTTGTVLVIGDDGERNITLPFAFNLDGVSSSNLRVGDNGGILFNTTTGNVGTGPTPTAQGFYAFADDLDSDYGDIRWQVLGTAPNRRAVIMWNNRPRYSNSASGGTFEIILYETSNEITFLYQDTDFGFNNPGNDAASAGIRVVGANGIYIYSTNTALGGVTCINWTPPVPPDNDDCINATPIACGMQYSGDTTLASDSGGNAGRDVYYSLAGTSSGEEITLSLCGSSYDTFLYVFDACNGTLITSNDDSCGLQSEVTFASDGTTTYIIRVDGFNAGSFGSFTLDVTCVPPPCTPPSTQATANGTINIDENSGSATLNWTRGDGDNVVVVMKEGSAVDSDPSIGMSYTGNANFGAGDNLGAGNFVVYNGPATTVNITGLNEDTTYHFAIYEYNTAGVCYNTDTTGAIGDFFVPCVTPINVSAFNATPGNTQITLGWTNSACFDDVLVVAREGSAVTAVPSGDGSAYTAVSAFGFGTEITTDEFVVYKGVGATEIITSLLNGTTYHFRVYTRRGTIWSGGVTISAVPVIDNYCGSISGDSTFEHITRVRLNTIDNAPGDNGSSPYTDFTAISTDLDKETQYTITIDIDQFYLGDNEFYSVWIDYNGNGDFSDPGEQVLNQNSTNLQVSGNFTVPFSANIGSTRMRVSLKFGAAQTACESFAYGEVEDYTINITGSVNYTYDDTNGWLPGDPNGVGTSIDTINIINGEAVISQDTKVDVLTIQPEGALSIPSPTILEVSGSVDMQSQSDQYSSLILDGTILGTVNYNRHINDFQSTAGATTGQNDLISPPLTNASQTFLDFRTINTNIPSGTIGGVPSWLFGPFDNNTNAYVNWSAANDGDVLVPGVGYRTASSTPTPNDTFVFTGDVQTGNVTTGISVGSGSEWNLIGNPFPSYLSADDFLNLASNNTLLDDNAVAIYGYDGTAQNGWDVINFNTTSGYNMAPGQGFLVAAKSGGSITFETSMRRNAGSDDFIPNRNTYNPYLKLQMSSGSSNYHTDFYFNDNSTRGLDRGYDAGIFNSNLPNFYIYSHLVDNNQGRKMAIQSLGVSDLSDVVIPLGLKVSQGQQVTIGIQDTSLPANVQVYLEDNLSNTFTLLNTGDYTFTANANIDGTGRFFLRYSEDTLSNPEQDLNALQIFTTKANELVVNGQLYSATTLSLYDIQGRAVFTTALDDRQTSQRINVSHLSSGVYVAKLNTGSQQKTQKVIIR